MDICAACFPKSRKQSQLLNGHLSGRFYRLLKVNEYFEKGTPKGASSPNPFKIRYSFCYCLCCQKSHQKSCSSGCSGNSGWICFPDSDCSGCSDNHSQPYLFPPDSLGYRSSIFILKIFYTFVFWYFGTYFLFILHNFCPIYTLVLLYYLSLV